MVARAIWFLLVGATTIGACAESTARPADGANAVVTGVIDGDTLDVTINGATERVRLLGIDTPESVDRDRPKQCFGAEAADHLDALTPAGTSVLLVRDIEPRDRFGRLLAYMYRVADGLFVNHSMVVDGYADVLIIDPNDAHASQLRRARSEAREAGVGLWGACGGPDVALDS